MWFGHSTDRVVSLLQMAVTYCSVIHILFFPLFSVLSWREHITPLTKTASKDGGCAAEILWMYHLKPPSIVVFVQESYPTLYVVRFMCMVTQPSLLDRMESQVLILINSPLLLIYYSLFATIAILSLCSGNVDWTLISWTLLSHAPLPLESMQHCQTSHFHSFSAQLPNARVIQYSVIHAWH